MILTLPTHRIAPVDMTFSGQWSENERHINCRLVVGPGEFWGKEYSEKSLPILLFILP